MMSFAGPDLALTMPCVTSKPIRISHCRTPSLSSTSSTVVSSTEDELLTESTTIGSSALDNAAVLTLKGASESDIDIDIDMSTCEPKTPLLVMTPTTPTDRFTKLSVSSRRAKGDAYLHRRHKSIHTQRREAVLAGERTPRSAGLKGFAHRMLRDEGARTENDGREAVNAFETKHAPAHVEQQCIDSSPAEPYTVITHEATPLRKVELALTSRRTSNKSPTSTRHQPYRFRQPTFASRHVERSGDRQPVIPVGSLPPALKSKLQGEKEQQWLLVGPDVARHLHMGGSVLVRDYAGNVVGWMS
ncbi:hypothetical protein QFC20_000577 [Naganishia adeliensis]|uniref:Uncharacterized protein n=1 Tax=Naganishia adeliensis TaxID=92952 RepID=A0ACC2WZQ6_9TREE|nr:hypothetical protein QFC20_000577 [Naganishia adeliensis]